MELNEIKDKIRENLACILEIELDDLQISDNELLFEGQIGFDSLMTLRLTVAIENEFNIVIEDEELTVELFESIDSLASFVSNKVNRT